MRIQVGSDVYDGSVRASLAALEAAFVETRGRPIMADLLQEIEAQIAGAKTAAAKQNVGVIREIGDGVAKVEGLADVDAQRDARLRATASPAWR